jgi:2'-5' RNA ligase
LKNGGGCDILIRMKKSGSQSESQIRSFVAIEISEEVRQNLKKLSAELKSRVRDVKWVRVEGIHLTLKFLGDISEKMIPSLRDVIREAARMTPFEMDVKGLGAFPNAHRPRVIWVGLEEPTGSLQELARRIEEGAKPLGFAPEDRPFNPHLTLGRVMRDGKPGNELEGLIERERERSLGVISTKEVILFRSDLKPDGAVYTKLETVKLGL